VAVLAEDARLTISPTGCAGAAARRSASLSWTAWARARALALRRHRRRSAAGSRDVVRRWGEDDYQAFTLVVRSVKDGQLGGVGHIREKT
jgi:hypothetical protein